MMTVIACTRLDGTFAASAGYGMRNGCTRYCVDKCCFATTWNLCKCMNYAFSVFIVVKVQKIKKIQKSDGVSVSIAQRNYYFLFKVLRGIFRKSFNQCYKTLYHGKYPNLLYSTINEQATHVRLRFINKKINT